MRWAEIPRRRPRFWSNRSLPSLSLKRSCSTRCSWRSNCRSAGSVTTMNALLFFADAQSGGQVEQIARTFGVDWSHLIAQIISFAIVCGILYLFAYKPVLKMLATRRQLIAQGLANSEKIK